MINQPTVSQMLADIGDASPAEGTDSNRPPHPASLDRSNPRLQEWCQLSAEEQLWQVEERVFERRLKAYIQKLHTERKIGLNALVAVARRHRANWRTKRRGNEPPSVKRQQENYQDFDDMNAPRWSGAAE